MFAQRGEVNNSETKASLIDNYYSPCANVLEIAIAISSPSVWPSSINIVSMPMFAPLLPSYSLHRNAFLCWCQSSNHSNNPFLLLAVLKLGVRPTTVAALFLIATQLCNYPFRPVDAALGKAPFHLCELKLQCCSLFHLARDEEVVDSYTCLVEHSTLLASVASHS